MPKATCSIDGCGQAVDARGWCEMHYTRWRRHGDPLIRLPGGLKPGTHRYPIEQRFWAKVHKTETCWLWTGSLNADGYGNFRGRGAHRVAYELVIGPIPEGHTLDHLCRVRHCVRPDHLEPLTLGENVLRGEGWSALNARKTHCPQGHAYTPENTLLYRDHRYCRACRLDFQQRQRCSK